MSANYSDEAFTQAVFRMETIYDIGIPFFDTAKIGVIDTAVAARRHQEEHVEGHDRIRPPHVDPVAQQEEHVVPHRAVLLALPARQPELRGSAEREPARLQDARQREVVSPGRRPGSCLVGGLDLPSTRAAIRRSSFRDKIRDWESIFTLAAFSFYRGGSIVPDARHGGRPREPVEHGAFWAVDYVVRDDFVVNLAQRYFITPRGTSTPIFETWGLGGLQRALRDVTAGHLSVLSSAAVESGRGAG